MYIFQSQRECLGMARPPATPVPLKKPGLPVYWSCSGLCFHGEHMLQGTVGPKSEGTSHWSLEHVVMGTARRSLRKVVGEPRVDQPVSQLGAPSPIFSTREPQVSMSNILARPDASGVFLAYTQRHLKLHRGDLKVCGGCVAMWRPVPWTRDHSLGIQSHLLRYGDWRDCYVGARRVQSYRT